MNAYKYIKKIYPKIFIVICSLFTIVSLYILFNAPYTKPIYSDGVGYYGYLPAIFIYEDIGESKLINELKIYDDYYNPPSLPDHWFGSAQLENGNYLNKYPVGIAFFMLPFFLAGHVATLALNTSSVNGFSYYYQLAIGICGLFYLIIGCYFFHKFLKKLFSKKIADLTTFAFFLGTNLLVYATESASYSHVYSFLLFAIFMNLCLDWHKKMTPKRSILLGLSLGFIIACRLTNVLIVLPFLLWNVSSIETLVQKFRFLAKGYKHLICIGIFTVIGFLPQIIYWFNITGQFFVRAYQGEEFTNLIKPEVLNVLFNEERGLLFWSPLLLISFIGIFLLYKKRKELFLSVIVFILLQLYLIASWWTWTFGGGFSHRAFTDGLIFFAIPIAAVIEFAFTQRQKFKILILLMILGLAILGAFYELLYFAQIVPQNGASIGNIVYFVRELI